MIYIIVIDIPSHADDIVVVGPGDSGYTLDNHRDYAIARAAQIAHDTRKSCTLYKVISQSLMNEVCRIPCPD